MSSGSTGPRPLTDDELRELPKVVAKVRKTLSITQVLALILGGATLISATVAIMEGSQVRSVQQQIRDEVNGTSARFEKDEATMKEQEGEITELQVTYAGTIGSFAKELENLSRLIERHIGTGR